MLLMTAAGDEENQAPLRPWPDTGRAGPDGRVQLLRPGLRPRPVGARQHHQLRPQ